MVNLVPMPDLTICSQLSLSFNREDSVIPFTVGIVSRPALEVRFGYYFLSKNVYSYYFMSF